MIINTNNTCYLSCVLQCLIHTKSMQRYLDAVPHHDNLFAKHFVELCKSVRRHIKTDPTQFYNLIRDKYKYFQNNDHHDAHEAFSVLLDRLTDAFPRIPHTMFRSSSRTARSVWSAHRDYHIIDEIFKIMHQVDYLCTRCKHRSTAYETDYVYYGPEESETLADYRCDRCGKSGTTTRSQRVIHYPQTLVRVHKTPVIPDPSLVLDRKYRLFAWINHTKFDDSKGHYRAVIRNDTKWILVDDDHTTELTKDLTAYMSFYEIIDF